VHAEYENPRSRIVRSYSPDEGKPTESLALHREIDDDHIRVVAAVHPVSGRDVIGIENRIDARVLENAPATLVYDRMIVDD
jgi:hypothetical protein